MNVIDYLSNKRVLIWGYGREGKSSENFIKTYCRNAVVEVYEGSIDGITEDNYDVIIKSPGIPMAEYNPKYTSQTELFLGQFRDKVIGITGTKGKSTTTVMMYEALKQCTNRQVLIVGNIGKPCLDSYGEITEDTIIVFELSCHQLANIKVSPHIAILLNIYEEHLDYYKTFEKYCEAKKNITANQSKEDYFFIGDSIRDVTSAAQRTTIEFPEEYKYNLGIKGLQNQYNAEFVLKVATTVFGCGKDEVLEALKQVKGLPHRLEKAGTVDGVTYYDDSIATIPEATIQAISAVPDVQTVIVGGMDRGIDYSKLVEYIICHKEYNFILCYQAGERIYQELRDAVNCIYVPDLYAAIEQAKKVTAKGKACLLSPAAPSYGYFKNFEERGDKFKEYLGLL